MAGRHPETHGREKGIRERKSGREIRERRDGLSLFCQRTPADLSSHLPIAVAFQVASSHALYCMGIWSKHKGGQCYHRFSTG